MLAFRAKKKDIPKGLSIITLFLCESSKPRSKNCCQVRGDATLEYSVTRNLSVYPILTSANYQYPCS